MSKLRNKLFAMVCAAAILAGSCALPVTAADTAGKPEPVDAPVVLSCTEIPLYIDNEYLGSGFVIDSVPFVPLLAFTECILETECAVEWDQKTATANITAGVLDLSLRTDQTYMVVNGRYLPLEKGVYNINGTLLVPISDIARVFTLELFLDQERWAIRIDTGNLRLLESGDEFYNAEDLYWLSHVISSEAGNQPLEGMIGVGNVVLNRVNDTSGAFRDTIAGVIFQPGQFDVVPTGTLYDEPREMAVVAAKLCLEGCNTVGESKWFVNPEWGYIEWFNTHKTFELTIADHMFYT